MPSESILITPQICNDLRTEYFNEPIDIYYSWCLHAPYHATPTITKPAKLTSWRTSTAYKEIPVPRPPHLESNSRNQCHGNDAMADGPSWRLILTCGMAADDRVVTLSNTDTIGRIPFMVMSMPVRFSRQLGRRQGTLKQERIMRSYALRVPLQEHPIVFDITEQTSFDLDKKIWDSGIGLSSWIAQLFSGKATEVDETLSDLHESLFGTDTRHILELGAGTGIVAITLAILRSTLDLLHQPGSIVTTDLPSAAPILQDNIASNRTLTSKCTPQAAVLDWNHEDVPPPVQAQLSAGLDVIVMADVTYNTVSFPALIGTLARLVQRCDRQRDGCPPRILMGYKERHSDERSFWDHAKEIGVCFRKIARVDGTGGNPVEIWLG